MRFYKLIIKSQTKVEHDLWWRWNYFRRNCGNYLGIWKNAVAKGHRTRSRCVYTVRPKKNEAPINILLPWDNNGGNKNTNNSVPVERLVGYNVLCARHPGKGLLLYGIISVRIGVPNGRCILRSWDKSLSILFLRLIRGSRFFSNWVLLNESRVKAFPWTIKSDMWS